MKIVMDMWIESGSPQLALIDGDTGYVLHQWRLEKNPPSQIAPLPAQCIACKSLVTAQQLIRKLFLLACHDNIARARIDDPCAHGLCRRSHLAPDQAQVPFVKPENLNAARVNMHAQNGSFITSSL